MLRSMLVKSEDDVLRCLSPLGFTREEAREITTTCWAIHPEHKIRAGMLSSIPKDIERRRLEGLPAFERLMRQFPRTHYFSMIPLADAYLQILAGAGSLFPELPYRQAHRQLTRESIDSMAANPMLKIMARAVEQDIGQYLRILLDSMSGLQNYGHREVEHVGPRHVVIHYEEDYPIVWFEAGLAFIEGVFEIFGAEKGRVSGKLLDPEDELRSPWTFDIQW